MTPEEVERTIQFLLNNQAAHDASLAELKVSVKEIATSVKELTGSVNDLTETTRSMQTEFREGFQTLISIAEQTSNAVRQVAEAEVRSLKRLDLLESRVDRLES